MDKLIGVWVIIGLLTTSVRCEQDNFLLVLDAASHIIHRSLNGSSTRYVVRDQPDITGFDLDYHTAYVYWSNRGADKILRAQIDRPGLGEVEDVISVNQPHGIAIDWVTRKLYFTNTDEKGSQHIQWFSLDAPSPSPAVFVTSLYSPTHLAIFPATKLLFWVDRGLLRNAGEPNEYREFAKIESASMDDPNTRKVLTETDYNDPDTIAIDYHARRLYFSDSNGIESMNLDGSDRRKLPLPNDVYRWRHFGLAIHEDQVYWTDPSNKTIFRTHKAGGEEVTAVQSEGLVQPLVIHIYDYDHMWEAGPCPEKWLPYEQHCYLISNLPERSHGEAEEYCQHESSGAGLVSINTRGELDFITQHLKSLYPDHQHWWTSGTDADHDGEWKWEWDNTLVDFSIWPPELQPPISTLFTFYLALSRVMGPDGSVQRYKYQILGDIQRLPTICEQGIHIDVDPCSVNNGNCQHSCVTVMSSHYCTCRQGFHLRDNGRDCDDINECNVLQPCPDTCQNLYGSYQCTCPSGYSWNDDNRTCSDVDECLQSPCEQRCVNIPGSYNCQCFWGYQLTSDNHHCEDTDECARDPCRQTCVNTEGSYICSCSANYTLGEDQHSCQRIMCGPPPQIEGFIVTCAANHSYFGDQCRIDCEQGTIIGATTITCGEGGEWKSPNSQCILSPGPTPDAENHPPAGVVITSSSVLESAMPGTVIGWLHGLDPDIDQSHTFTLNSHTDVFTVSAGGADTRLILINKLDYETSKSYALQIQVTDNGTPPLSFMSTVTINIVDVNEPPTPPTLSPASVNENVPRGTLIGHLESHDFDEGQELNFRLHNNQENFRITNRKNVVVAGELNFENKSSYSLSIEVIDNGIPPAKVLNEIAITILDVNEPPQDVELSTQLVPEYIQATNNINIGTVVATFDVTDVDADDTHTITVLRQGYTADRSRSYECFKVTDNLQLTIGDTNCFDYERQRYFRVQFMVQDKEGLTLNKTFEINLQDLNDPPSRIIFSANHVIENSRPGTSAGLLYTTDEFGDTHVYSLVKRTSMFEIRGNELKIRGGLDFESPEVNATGHVTLEVRATDNGGLSLVQNISFLLSRRLSPPIITVTLNDRFKCSDAAHATTPSPDVGVLCISEDTAVRTRVAQISVTDQSGIPMQSNITLYSMTHLFMLEDGAIVLHSPLDFESVDEKAPILHVRAVNTVGMETDQFIIVQISNSNDAPSSIDLSSSIVPQDAAPQYVIGRFRCRDQDVGDTHTYLLIESAGQMFEVDTMTGELTLATMLPTSPETHTITAQCFDASGEGSPLSAGKFTIEIQQPLDNSLTLTLSTDTLPENTNVGAIIGSFVLHGLSSTEEYTISLQNPDHVPFTVAGTQLDGWSLRLHQEVDYENQPYYHMVVMVTVGTNTMFANFTLKVEDVSEAPRDILLDTNIVAEGTAGRKFGVAVLVGGEPGILYHMSTDSPDFYLMPISAISASIFTQGEFDYESQRKHFLNITASHSLTPEATLTKSFTVYVMNMNEPPTSISVSKIPVRENAPPGLLAATITVTDPDGDSDEHECIVLDGGFGWFVAGTKWQQSPQIYTATSVDYEDPRIAATHEVQLLIQCWDWLGETISITTAITILDANEPPTEISKQGGGVFTIPENSRPGSVVGILVTDDPDINDTHSYSTDSLSTSPFAIIGDRLIAHTSLNYEAQRVHSMNVTVTDSGRASFTKEISIFVSDVNEAPTGIALQQNNSVRENSPEGTVIDQLVTYDMDWNQQFTYVIHTQTPEGAVRLQDVNTLVVKNSLLFDYERYPEILVTIISTDNGSPSMDTTQTIKIQVEDVNEAPIVMTLTNENGGLELGVWENATAGTVIGHINVEDPDKIPSQFFFCMLAAESEGPFQHASSDGWSMHDNENNYIELVMAGILNYEKTTSYNVVIMCVDNGGLSIHKEFTVQVWDCNEAPRGILVEPADYALAMKNVDLNLDQLLDLDNEYNNSLISVPEQTGQRIVVAYLYVVDEDDLHEQKQTHIISLISVKEYQQALNIRQDRDSTPSDNVNFTVEYGSPWQTLVAKGQLDFEVRPYPYMLHLKCQDSGTPKKTIYRTIQVRTLNVSEAPVDIAMSSQSIAENSPPKTLIGPIVINDLDQPVHGYNVTIPDKTSPFLIDGHKLYVRDSKQLDFESAPEIAVTIRVEEIGTDLMLEQTLTITLTDENDPPCCLTVDGVTSIYISMTTAPGSVIGQIKVQDEDADDSHEYEMKKDTDNLFSIVDNKLILAKAVPASVSVSHLESLWIQATDSGGLSTAKMVYISFIPRPAGQPVSCLESPCSNNAYCDKTMDPPQCKCTSGYSGLDCSVSLRSCDNIVCPRNGVCTPWALGHVCRCSEPYTVNCTACISGYSGNQCQICTECEIAAESASTSSDSSLITSHLPWILGSIIAILALIVLILTIAGLIYRQRRKARASQATAAAAGQRVRYDSTDGSCSIGAVGQGQYANPLYESLGYVGQNNNTQSIDFDDVFQPMPEKLTAHIDALNYHPGSHSSATPSNDLDSGVVEDGSECGDGQRIEANRELGMIAGPHEVVVAATAPPPPRPRSNRDSQSSTAALVPRDSNSNNNSNAVIGIVPEEHPVKATDC